MESHVPAGSTVPLKPTFTGYVHSTLDAVLLFEACLSGRLPHVPRRPHDRERQGLIRSGHIFIYEENSSGIKRWTDGVIWSPSRILGNYLIYRELDRPFPPGEKKRAAKKDKDKKPNVNGNGVVRSEPTSQQNGDPNDHEDRYLIGSLTESYPFKEDGLVKKTISVSYRGIPHHLVSYYKIEDVKAQRLQRPSACSGVNTLVPRYELLFSQSFRAPVDDDMGSSPATGPLLAAVAQAPLTPYGSNARSQSTPTAAVLPSSGHWQAGFMTQPPQQQHLHSSQHPHGQQMMFQQHHLANGMQAMTSPPLNNMSFVTPALPSGYGFDPNMARSRFASSAGLSAETARNLMADPMRRHSTAYDPSSGHLMTTPTLTHLVPEPMRPATHTNGHHFNPGAFDFGNPSSQIPDPATQHHDNFPSPRTVPQTPPPHDTDNSGPDFGDFGEQAEEDWDFTELGDQSHAQFMGAEGDPSQADYGSDSVHMSGFGSGNMWSNNPHGMDGP